MSHLPMRGALGAALVLVMLGAAACLNPDGGPQEAEVISAIDILDNAGLHGIDESINEENEIPATARTTALHLQAVTELTDWPGELDQAAEDLATTFGNLAAALERDDPDLAEAGELAAKAHDDQHALSRAVWAWLQEEAGIEVEEEGEHE